MDVKNWQNWVRSDENGDGPDSPKRVRIEHSATRKDLPPSAQEGGARREAVGGPGLFDC